LSITVVYYRLSITGCLLQLPITGYRQPVIDNL
jgi:hypothetical protein